MFRWRWLPNSARWWSRWSARNGLHGGGGICMRRSRGRRWAGSSPARGTGRRSSGWSPMPPRTPRCGSPHRISRQPRRVPSCRWDQDQRVPAQAPPVFSSEQLVAAEDRLLDHSRPSRPDGPGGDGGGHHRPPGHRGADARRGPSRRADQGRRLRSGARRTCGSGRAGKTTCQPSIRSLGGMRPPRGDLGLVLPACPSARIGTGGIFAMLDAWRATSIR